MADNEPAGTQPEEIEEREEGSEAAGYSSPGIEADLGEGPSGLQFLDREARCVDEDDGEEDDDYDDMFDRDTDSDGWDTVDNASAAQGNTLALYARQEAEDAERELQILKRKYICSPASVESTQAGNALSPHLEAICISPQQAKKARKALFVESPASGTQKDHETSNCDVEVEAEPPTEQVQGGDEGGEPMEQEPTPLQTGQDPGTQDSAEEQGSSGWDSQTFVTDLLRHANGRARVLALLKESLAVSFTEMTRQFRSNKTGSLDWVIGVVGVREHFYEASQYLLREHCDYVLMKRDWTEKDIPVVIMLLRFKHQKSRDTLVKTVRSVLQVHEAQLVMEPPKTNSTPAALYWVKLAESGLSFCYGPVPEWITRLTQLSHAISGVKPFVLSTMVQWAYDNDFVEESTIALEYAMLGEEDENAAAFVSSNGQARYVRDCATMVRYYKRAEMSQMNMGEWIHRCSLKVDTEPDDWRVVVKFLRSQQVEIIPFLVKLKYFLKGIPKKNCLCIYGPPDTGKSMFCMSLIRHLSGKVLSFVNSKSQFWLQPLADAKIALIDDVTKQFWDYCDTYLRTGLDGNPISLDCKHKAPVQVKFPPLLITTNVSVDSDDRWKYLQSRIKTVCFPTVQGTPAVQLEGRHWSSFFTKFWVHLELPQVDLNDGNARPTLRLNPRADTDPN